MKYLLGDAGRQDAGTGPAGTGPAGTGPAGTGPPGTGPSGTALGCPKSTSLPSPRTITNTLNTDIDIPSTQVTHMVAQFGQFLDHDIGKVIF